MLSPRSPYAFRALERTSPETRKPTRAPIEISPEPILPWGGLSAKPISLATRLAHGPKLRLRGALGQREGCQAPWLGAHLAETFSVAAQGPHDDLLVPGPLGCLPAQVEHLARHLSELPPPRIAAPGSSCRSRSRPGCR